MIATSCVLQNNALRQTGLERHRVVKAGEATVHISVRGEGDPIVFIPSRGRGAEDFDDLSNRLMHAGCQAILPQPRGIGGSTGPLEGITYHDLAADIAATIRELVGRPAVIVGHAFGSRLARTLAADHPTLVKHLVLIAAPGPVARSTEVSRATDRVFDPTLTAEDRLKAIQQAFFARGNDARVWQEGWHLDVARAQRATDARTPLKEWWAGGSAPMLVLQGAEDVIAPPENARQLAAEFPDRVTVIEFAHAGHAMLPEQPERIAEAIVAYLAR
jgi:pimeloyl-ACP methyl ester carboxylesterase